jgi:hypothetical protein
MKKLLALLLLLAYGWSTVNGYNYRPNGRAFVCVNGDNRLTRSLYGATADYVLQTSDRPFFKVLQNKEYRQLSFRINGVDLEKANYCLSRYQDGMRSYEVKHPAWGKRAVVRIKAVVGQQENRVVWRLRMANFNGPVKLELPYQKASVNVTDDTYLSCSGLSFAFLPVRQGEALFDRMESDMQRLASTIKINTPDKYINPMGSALSVVRKKTKDVSVEEQLWHLRYDADADAMRRLWPSIDEYVQTADNTQLSTSLLAKSYWLNTMAARIAASLQRNGASYFAKADKALALLNEQLWMADKGCWAESKDQEGLRRLHDTPALWSVYAPIDYDACTPEQAYLATKYMDRAIPHIPVTSQLSTLATSNWMPYTQDLNNVNPATVMGAALACFKAGRNEEGFRLLKATVIDQMYDGSSPANFGQTSKYDAVNGEQGFDSADHISIAARTLTEGLFGIRPDAFSHRCIIHPGFPELWDSASISTPYIDYRFRRQGNLLIYDITQRFPQSQQIVLRVNLGKGEYRDILGTDDKHQVITVDAPLKLPEVYVYSSYEETPPTPEGTDEPSFDLKFKKVDLTKSYNDSVSHIRPEIVDTFFRNQIVKDEYLVMGVPFRTPAVGPNIVCASLSDRYPDQVSIPVKGRADKVWLLLAGTTSTRESRMVNGLIVARYEDGSADTLRLVNPDNWCPVEQDYYVNDYSFHVLQPRPYRVSFDTGIVSRNLSKAMRIKGTSDLMIPGGAAQMLCMSLDPEKKVVALDIIPQSNGVVVGLMGLTLQ